MLTLRIRNICAVDITYTQRSPYKCPLGLTTNFLLCSRIRRISSRPGNKKNATWQGVDNDSKDKSPRLMGHGMTEGLWGLVGLG